MGDADRFSSAPLEASVSWTVGPPQRAAQGYVTEISIQIENPGAAENLAVLAKSEAPLQAFGLFEAGAEGIERSSSRRLRDGRELIVVSGELADRYVARATTEGPVALEAEAVLDVPFW
jgi:hypothetical protein